MHGGDRVAEVLKAQGVRCVFTLCGGHVSPILTGARAQGIRVVDTRHEATAVFAADAMARMTGTPGVAVVTAGPGLTNTITAVKNAQLAQSPLIVIGGATATVLKGRGALQDIDQVALMEPHVKQVLVVGRIRELVPNLERAFAIAKSGVPGPVFLECPVDLLYPEDVVREWYGIGKRGGGFAGRVQRLYLRRHLGRMFDDRLGQRPGPAMIEPVPGAVAEQVLAVGQKLRAARRPLLIVGSQAVCEPDRVASVAEAVDRIGVPVYLSGMARGLLGSRHPRHYRHRRREALKSADVVILAGVPCDFRLDYGRHVQRGAVLVSANRSRDELRLNRKPDIGLLADPGSFLADLSRAAPAAGDAWSDWRAELDGREQEREDGIVRDAAESGEFANPLAVCRGVNQALSEDSIVVADGGDFVGTASYIVRPRGPLRWLDPGVFGTLGVGAGFAIGAAVARPGSQVWALFGDGSLGYSLSEFDTFVRHQIPLIAVVGNDGCWSQIAREQVKLLKDDVGVMLQRSDYHRVVAGFGASGLVIHDDGEIADVLEQACEIARGGHPVLVNALLGRSDFREGSISI
ncbi:MAG: thiamine pyrophosphate-binding protein [Gammaproteobacteria bacterium]